MSYEYGADIRVGCRVELSPHFDLWMRGARYGRVTKIVGDIAIVRMEVRGLRLQRLPMADLRRVRR